MNIRDEIIEALEREIVGPSPNENYLDEETGEELLLLRVHGAPKSRYGAGMLYPQQSINTEVDDCEENRKKEELEYIFESDADQIKNSEKSRSQAMSEIGAVEEEPVGLANQYYPSALGFTLRIKANETDDLIRLNIESAVYKKATGEYPTKKLNSSSQVEVVLTKGKPYLSPYWVRKPIKSDEICLKLYDIFLDGQKSFEKIIQKTENEESWLKLRIFNRTTSRDKEDNFLTYTFVLINDLKSSSNLSNNAEKILYQNRLILNTDNCNLIAPYNEKNSSIDTEEEKELNLLYRNKRVFAIGHGTAVSWKVIKEKGIETVKTVQTSIIPVYDLPQVAPTNHVELSMLELSDLGDWNNSKKILHNLVTEYSQWIDDTKLKVQNSPELKNYRDAADNNIFKCLNSLDRMKKGINHLIEAEESSNIVKCFRWMNRAMLWQQQRSKTKQRKWIKSGKGENSQYFLEGINDKENQNFSSLDDFHNSSPYNGRWRPFQLAFILMNLDSIINPLSEERKIVDLIWFPTGGGKTEAYLGLSAFNIFYRRFKGEKKWNWNFYGGTSILMRYTLRLLTTQQYERAASLICACDLIRKKNNEILGDEAISIGLWVGGTSTPNENKNARSELKKLKEEVKTEYNFVVMKCPCCGAQIGKIDGASYFDSVKVKGLRQREGNRGEVYFQCENSKCEYADIPLPLQVIDEIIYQNPPTLLLGTVDKFAMIPWKKEVGQLFGLREKDNNWSRITPPDLIIQDELHLIAGPLGTMVGLYETMIQTLCNDYNKQVPPFITDVESNIIPPKIIASSATISRAFEQVKSLYGITDRKYLNIFPAQGIDFGDTWFSEEKSLDELKSDDNQKYPGRKYIGILASGYPSAQTAIVRAYASVLQKVKEMDENEYIDYYWSLLGYFNSIRELGGASSLVYGDIRERLGQIQNRELVNKDNKRYLNKIQELTSRINSSEIPASLKKLETQYYKNRKNKALDICLASNMVATGVDISRLGLMFIHGQPKTTAEYIQASSRVGRDIPNGPGLIITLYSPAKPRDKSQYEQFQGYHSRIYSHVEPTSVTPFSINARERGLHALQIGMIRHFSCDSLKSSPEIDGKEFDDLVSIVNKIIIERCNYVDPEEVKNTEILLNKRVDFWKKGFQRYGDGGNYGILHNDDYFPLMYANSAEVKDEIIKRNRSLATPTSMRGVDSESEIGIYSIKDN